jgi:hypothetical protein
LFPKPLETALEDHVAEREYLRPDLLDFGQITTLNQHAKDVSSALKVPILAIAHHFRHGESLARPVHNFKRDGVKYV